MYILSFPAERQLQICIHVTLIIKKRFLYKNNKLQPPGQKNCKGKEEIKLKYQYVQKEQHPSS